MTPTEFLTLRGLMFWGGFLLFLSLELIKPYREPSVAKTRRIEINIGLAILNSILIGLIFSGATIKSAFYVTEHHLGLLNIVNLPRWLGIILALLFLDFMLYVWHLLNHTVPFLWRFHRVHHSDLNMDVSTAARFHCGEILISGVIKIGLIFFSGAGLVGIFLFEVILVLAAQFQHSSLAVPPRLEQALWKFLAPPAMHRIHHSVKIQERNRNYGTILSLWDRIFGTLRTDVDQDGIIIGLGAYRDPGRLKFPHLLRMPFTQPVK